LVWAFSTATALPSDNASSFWKPRRSATIVAQRVSSGARFTEMVFMPAPVGHFAAGETFAFDIR
jgi:hypothetical protein